MKLIAGCVVALAVLQSSQSAKVDWTAADAELISHFQQLVRFDTTDPPGGERPAVEYLKKVLERRRASSSRNSRSSPIGRTWSRD